MNPSKIPGFALVIIKEAARHLLRRPVIGVVACAQTKDGRWLLIRRRDTGQWALPGGTLEWGETLQSCITREIREEAGAEVLKLGDLLGVYSHPDRDFRFHAVTVVVNAEVSSPDRPPVNPLEVAEVGLFSGTQLPPDLSHQMSDMLKNAVTGKVVWE